MQSRIRTNSIDDYRLFLKVKGLPRYKFVGGMAEFPDEYASLIGEDVGEQSATTYRPIKGLFDYQEGIARIAIRKRKFAAFMACGSGKTLVMTEFARHVHSQDKSRPTLIVSPLMVVRQTVKEVGKFYGRKFSIQQLRANELAEWLRTGSGVGITNYEAIVDGLPPGRLAGLILDESAMLKSHYGKWGQRLIAMGRGLNWKLCLTGVPAPNDRIEYANHAVFLDQCPTVNSFLARFFVNRGQTDNRWELKPHALRPFYRALSHWCIFLSNPAVYGWKDNCDTIPQINTHIDYIDMSEEQATLAAAESDSLFPIAGGIASRAKLAQIAKGNHNGRRIESSKPAVIRKLVDSWPNESTIVWCRYNAEQERVAEVFPEAANISGDTPEDERPRLIDEFQNGTRKVLISKCKILGFGLNLQVATRMIFSTLQDSYEEFWQAVKRANRYGATRPLNVHVPITEIERPMVENVLRKARMVDEDTRQQELLFKEFGYAAE
jgi:Helicase conserved C-terminal domain/Type III restriction enzyme, res subunit